MRRVEDNFLVLDGNDMKPELLGRIHLQDMDYSDFKPDVQKAIRAEGFRYVKYTNDVGGYHRILPYSRDFGRFCAVNGIKNDYVIKLMNMIELEFGIDPSNVAQIALCWEVNSNPVAYGLDHKVTRVDLGYVGRKNSEIGD